MKIALGVLVGVVALVGMALLWWGCPGPVIALTVPDGFQGKIALVEDPAATESLAWTCGNDGVVRVRSAAVLYEWHSFRARYASGVAIPNALELDGARRLTRETTTVCLFTDSGLFVGTPAQAARAQRWYFRHE